MDQNKKKGMWIRQQESDSASGKTWMISMIMALLSCELLIITLIELTGFTDIYTPWVMVFAAGCAATTYGLLIKLNKQKLFLPTMLAMLLVLALLCGKPLIGGICTFINQAGDALTAAGGWATPELEASTGRFGLFVFSCFVGIVVTVLCCALTSIGKYINAIIVPLIIFALMIMFRDDDIEKYIAACLVAGMCMLVCGGREERTLKCMLARWLPVIVCSVLMLVMVTVLSTGQWALEISDSVHNKLHSARYETEYSTLPEGNFSAYEEGKGNGETALVVSMEQPEEMYLRGFTAAQFTKDTWKPLDTEASAENESLLFWMNSNGFNPQMQFNCAASLIEKNEETKERSLKKVTIQNLNACSEYMYVPYSVSSSELLDEKNINQRGVSADGNRMYTYSVVPEGDEKISKILNTLKHSDNEGVEKYRQVENAYREFVQKYYIHISDEIEEQMVPYWEMISSSEGRKDKITIAEAQNYVRVFLEECFPEEGDAPKMELPLDKVRGSSYQYATIAVLTLRYYGIPARYAEGYVITEEKAEEMEKNGSVQLDGNSAGAWAEVYQDGIGWIPMNITPGLEEENSGMDPDADNGEEPQQVPPKGAMKLDDIDDMSEEPDPDGGYVVSIKKVISYTALAVALLLLLTMLFLIVRRHLVLKRRAKRWDTESVNDGVAWIFADAEVLMKKLGFDRDGGSMNGLIGAVEESLSSDYARSLQEMIELNSHAMFSSRKMDENQRETARAFYIDTLEYLKADAQWYKKLWMQWVLCLY